MKEDIVYLVVQHDSLDGSYVYGVADSPEEAEKLKNREIDNQLEFCSKHGFKDFHTSREWWEKEIEIEKYKVNKRVNDEGACEF